MTGIAELAERVDDAARIGKPIAKLTESAELSVEQAYRVQAASVGRRVARGERLSGVKMGFTSRAKMAQMGVDEVIWGRLTDAMRLADGDTAPASAFIHPRIEPEIAFLIGRPIVPGESVVDHVVAVAPALEVIDSRYDGFSFTLADVVADNTSAAGYVTGPWRKVPRGGIGNLGVVLEADGRVAQTGSTAAILGNPWRSLASAVRLAGKAGLHLEAGWVVLAGGATAAIPFHQGAYVRATLQGLGSVGIGLST